MSKVKFTEKPVDTDKIVVHACCAPCSTAMVDYLLECNITPVIFYYNPNIFPEEEYNIRKTENQRYIQTLGLKIVDADYDHEEWKRQTWNLRYEPERGKRCEQCFDIRLIKTAQFAHENGYQLFATTLATSRCKDLEQVNRAGNHAAGLFPGLTFWANNWRKNGLTEKRAQLIREYGFYCQQYCGCEYSLRDSNKWRKENGRELVRPGAFSCK